MSFRGLRKVDSVQDAKLPLFSEFRRTSLMSIGTYFGHSGRVRPIVFCGLAVAILATAAAIHLHMRSFTKAGGLWRDEVTSANVATLPTLGAMWETLPHDSFPILFPLIVRGWSATVGELDVRLRWLGLSVGLFLLASFSIAGAVIWRGPPLLSLTLFALNVMAIRYGDSLRAYGLGVACIVLTLAATWRFVEAPTLFNGTIATVLATLSVQALYQNAFFVLAICVAGCAVHLYRRRLPAALMVLAIGVVPALSLAPYIRPLLHAQDWWVLQQYGLTLTTVEGNISSLTAHPKVGFEYVWAFLVVAAIGLGIESFFSRSGAANSRDRHARSLFATVALVLGVVGFGVFLFLAKLPTQLWYYLPLAGFAIVCCDAILGGSYRWVQDGVLVAAAIVVVLAYPAGLSELDFRQTNGDLLAEQLSQRAGPEDLIVVNPWYCGVTFARYYRGAAPWTTLAGFDDYRYHRYDLLKLKMELDHPAQPVLDRVTATLHSGHTVWIVGWLPALHGMNAPPADLLPAPLDRWGWKDEPYTETWGAQFYYLIKAHADKVGMLPQPANLPINRFENLQLVFAKGWR
jgi:hypothetical protein